MKSTRRKHSKKVRHSRRKHSRRNHRDGVGFFDNLKAGITNLAGSPLDKAKLKLKQLQEKQTELTTYLSEAEKTKRMTKIETDAKIEEEKEIKKRTSEADVNNENLKNNLKNKNKELSSKKEEVNKIKDYINNRPKRLEEYQAKESADETTNKNKITEINEQIKTIDSEINQIGGYGKIDNDYKIIINEIEKTAKSNKDAIINGNKETENTTNGKTQTDLNKLPEEITKAEAEVKRLENEKAAASVKKDGRRRKRSKSRNKSKKRRSKRSKRSKSVDGKKRSKKHSKRRSKRRSNKH